MIRKQTVSRNSCIKIKNFLLWKKTSSKAHQQLDKLLSVRMKGAEADKGYEHITGQAHHRNTDNRGYARCSNEFRINWVEVKTIRVQSPPSEWRRLKKQRRRCHRIYDGQRCWPRSQSLRKSENEAHLRTCGRVRVSETRAFSNRRLCVAQHLPQ